MRLNRLVGVLFACTCLAVSSRLYAAKPSADGIPYTLDPQEQTPDEMWSAVNQMFYELYTNKFDVSGGSFTGPVFISSSAPGSEGVSGTGSASTQTAGHVLQDEGTDRPQRLRLNFIGAGVTAADAAGVTEVTVPVGTFSLVFTGLGVSITQVGTASYINVPGGNAGNSGLSAGTPLDLGIRMKPNNGRTPAGYGSICDSSASLRTTTITLGDCCNRLTFDGVYIWGIQRSSTAGNTKIYRIAARSCDDIVTGAQTVAIFSTASFTVSYGITDIQSITGGVAYSMSVATTNASSIYGLDGADGTILSRDTLDGTPHTATAVTSDGSLTFVGDGTRIYASDNRPPAEGGALDLTDYEAMYIIGDTLYVGGENASSGGQYRINKMRIDSTGFTLETTAVLTGTAQQEDISMISDGSSLFVGGPTSDATHMGHTGHIIKFNEDLIAVERSTTTNMNSAQGNRFVHDGKNIWATNDQGISKYELDSLLMVGHIPATGQIGIAFDGEFLWTGDGSSVVRRPRR